MIPLAAVLIAVSLFDCLALLPRTAAGRSGTLPLVAVVSALAATLMFTAYGAWEIALLTLLTLGPGGWAWCGLRDKQNGGWIAIAALAAMLASAAFVAPALVPAGSVQTSVPIPGLLLFLGPTANAVVKTVMVQIRSFDYDASEQQLKGGRYIGPLERWLIFGLALAGQPTAAALVISAKSIIRFPELQSKAGRPRAPDTAGEATGLPGEQQIDDLTEYFLIGSLLSWLLALVAALPVAPALR